MAQIARVRIAIGVATWIVTGASITVAGCSSRELTTDDSAILARFAKSDPCPLAPPPVWLTPDSTLAQTQRCSLVAATARSLAATSDEPWHQGMQNAVCVAIVASAFPGTSVRRSDEAYWLVDFIGPDGTGVGARINRVTGDLTLHRFGSVTASCSGPRRIVRP